MNLKNICLSYLILLLLFDGAASAKYGFIEGYIYDSVSGKPISGVEIRLHYSANDEYTYDYGSTDDNGYFGFKSRSKADTYYLICIAPNYGYQRTSEFKTDSEGNVQGLEFRINPVMDLTEKAFYTPEINNEKDSMSFRIQIIGPRDTIEYGNSYNYKVRVTSLEASNPQTKIMLSYSDDCISLKSSVQIKAINKKGIEYDIDYKKTLNGNEASVSWAASAVGLAVPDPISLVTGVADLVKQVGEWNTKNTIQQAKDIAFYDDNKYDIITIPIPNPLKAVNGEDVYWREVETTIPLYFEHGVTEPRLYFWIGCMDSAGGGSFWCDTNDDPASPFEIKPNELSGDALIEVSQKGENNIAELTVIGGRITDVIWPTKDSYNRSEPVPVKVDFTNIGSEPHSFYVGYSVQDSSGKWWDAPARQAWATQPGENGSVELKWKPPEDAPEGTYTAKVALWGDQNSDTGLMEDEFDHKTKENSFQLNPIQVQIVPQSEALNRWSKTFGGSEDDIGRSVEQTTDGGYIITGDTKSFGAGNNDVWLIKTDENGYKIWDKTFGGPENDHGRSVQETTDGGYIIAGDTRSYGAGNDDVWLIKTDANGDKLWDKTFGGPENDCSHSVQPTSDGGYIIAGDTYSYGTGADDGWLIKTDENGRKLWDKTFGDQNNDCWNSVQQTSDDGYVIAGYTDYHQNVYRLSELCIMKVDMNGDQIWNKKFTGDAIYPIANAYSVQETTDNGYILIGYEGASSVMGPDNTDICLIKVDADGNISWNNDDFGGSSKGSWDNLGLSVQQTDDGGFIFVGLTPSYTSRLHMDFSGVLIKTDSNGYMIWKKRFEDSADNILSSVRQTADEGYIMLGSTNHVGAGGYDIWLVKTDANGNVEGNVQ